MIIYFKGTRDNYGFTLREYGISLLLKGALRKRFREQWNLLIRNKGEKVKFSRDQGNMLPPQLLQRSFAKSSRREYLKHLAEEQDYFV